MQNNHDAAVASSQGMFVGAPMTRFMTYLTGLAYAIIESRGSHDELAVGTSIIQHVCVLEWVIFARAFTHK
jgi:hypothetical protein